MGFHSKSNARRRILLTAAGVKRIPIEPGEVKSQSEYGSGRLLSSQVGERLERMSEKEI